MAIDSAEKRRSISGILVPFLIAGVTPNASPDLEWRQESAWGYSGIAVVTVVTPPADDDADVSVTTRTDRQGSTIRPARVTIRHAADDSRNGALIKADRTQLDRYRVTSIRQGRTPNEGRALRVHAACGRAGECFAPRDIILDLDVIGENRLATDTTARTDRQGSTLMVPTWQTYHAPNSARHADLERVGTDRDRHWTAHSVPADKQEGFWHRILVTDDGRAGNAGVPAEIILDLEVLDGQPPGAKDI